nr:hypothetical protein [Fundidesulfovibrio soli]
MARKTGDGNTAVYYLKPLAFLGERTAQRLLGEIYALGQAGIDINDAEAIYWFGRCGVSLPTVLGDGENPAAPHEVEVAKQYATGGWGVKADPVECAKWLTLAAEGGNKEAQALLAQSFCQ